jgi:hypothetical protein
MTDPAVGASTCASGSQVWNGNIGTLMAKASAKAANSHICVPGSTGFRDKAATSKVASPDFVYSAKKATSISALPAIV